jgi:outer membrane protein assembly factor BamB
MRTHSLGIAVLAGLAATAPRAADWPRWRGPQGNGVIPAEPLTTKWPNGGPPVQWRAEVGVGFSSIVVASGRIYTIGHRGDEDVLVCLDADTGSELWRRGYPAVLDPNLFEGGPTGSPTVDGDDVFVFSRQGLAICFQASSGEERWRVDVPATCQVQVPGWGFAGSPVVHEGRVLLNAGSAGVALDRSNGAVLWQSDDSDAAAYSTPLIADLAGRPTALILSGKALHAVDPATGTEFWNHRWITRYGINAADPLVQGEHVLLTSGYAKGNSLLHVEAAGVDDLWRKRDLRNQMCPGVLVGGHVYAVDGDENEETRLKCLDFLTGEVRWEHEGLGSATLVACGELLVILSGSGELVLAPASPAGFEPIARASVLTGKCWTPPALADGRAFCRNAAGQVICVDLRP